MRNVKESELKGAVGVSVALSPPVVSGKTSRRVMFKLAPEADLGLAR